MAGSPSCSSAATSPNSASEHQLLLLQQEADAFSDDSGVDVKPTSVLKRRGEEEEAADKRRNKRKSSEPKRRKDVLLMKRFRWEDTDEEDVRDFEEDEDDEDVFDVQRPGSGDSGCRLDATRSPPVQEEAHEQTRNLLRSPQGNATKHNNRRRQWRKQPIKKEEEDEDTLPACRQSVIRKNEATTTTTTSCTTTTLLHRHNDPPPAQRAGPSPTVGGTDHSPDTPPKDYELVEEEGSGSQCCGSAVSPDAVIRCGGRPRNYKSMSRQRRIEANARERTRVHTISAAFESLRRAVPAYAHNQKLSKLAILRIASAYIVALACLNDNNNVGGGGRENVESTSMSECVERCTRTIQAEGRSRRRTSKE